MRNVIGILQALLEQGGVGVLDLMTFTLYSPEDFKERFFEKEVNAQNHAFILASKERRGTGCIPGAWRLSAVRTTVCMSARKILLRSIRISSIR